MTPLPSTGHGSDGMCVCVALFFIENLLKQQSALASLKCDVFSRDGRKVINCDGRCVYSEFSHNIYFLIHWRAGFASLLSLPGASRGELVVLRSKGSVGH